MKVLKKLVVVGIVTTVAAVALVVEPFRLNVGEQTAEATTPVYNRQIVFGWGTEFQTCTGDWSVNYDGDNLVLTSGDGEVMTYSGVTDLHVEDIVE